MRQDGTRLAASDHRIAQAHMSASVRSGVGSKLTHKGALLTRKARGARIVLRDRPCFCDLLLRASGLNALEIRESQGSSAHIYRCLESTPLGIVDNENADETLRKRIGMLRLVNAQLCPQNAMMVRKLWRQALGCEVDRFARFLIGQGRNDRGHCFRQFGHLRAHMRPPPVSLAPAV